MACHWCAYPEQLLNCFAKIGLAIFILNACYRKHAPQLITIVNGSKRSIANAYGAYTSAIGNCYCDKKIIVIFLFQTIYRACLLVSLVC